ncbi:MAG: ABC transporter ATP-binding protein [Nitrospira sp. LK70]|nr:ABC transporter ATP-binding protein [Nitrospira sp. LK70]
MNDGAPPDLQALGITKRFGPLTALKDVDFRLQSGQFHALLGENGAGKSTLVKCIMGYYHPDEGNILLDQQPVTIRNPRDAQTFGIGMVYQQFTLIPNMTVLENLAISKAKLNLIINWQEEESQLTQFMEKMPFKVPLSARVGSLAAGEKQKVEILKQLALQNRILILDEPTSVLTPQEAKEVLGHLRAMTLARQLSILIITHKLREVAAFADEVTVLRKGQFVGSGLASELKISQIAEMMVGSEVTAKPKQRTVLSKKVPKLVLQDIRVKDDIGVEVVRGLHLTIHEGEIVGVAGVSGNGQRELVEVLAGQRQAVAGTIRVQDQPFQPTREKIMRHKMFCLPEEPLQNTCVGRMTVSENLAFRNFDVVPHAIGGWLISRSALRRSAFGLIERYNIKPPHPDIPIQSLSGGNVQRAVLARELSAEVEILIIANPCFGLDFLAMEEIRLQIVAARNRGTAVLLVSEDLDEILELSDRTVVMFNGRLVYETTSPGADLAIIGRHMTGHAT